MLLFLFVERRGGFQTGVPAPYHTMMPNTNSLFQAPPGSNIFDRVLLRQRRLRAYPSFENHRFILREVVARMGDRLADIERKVPAVLHLGAQDRSLTEALTQQFGTEDLIEADCVRANPAPHRSAFVVADEEWLPFREQAFDLVLSLLTLHAVNDLPGVLVQARRCLRPGGLFLAALFGGESLTEMRQAWADAELAVEGGISPRVSPFVDVREAGALLQRAKFALPVADVDTLTITYPDPLALMRDLRGMGETNILTERRRTFLRRKTLLKFVEAYQDRFGLADGRIPATVQLVWLTGRSGAAPDPE